MADPAVAVAEHEREAERPEQDAAEARVDDALEQDVHDLAGAGEAGLEHHEARLHEEHQEAPSTSTHAVFVGLMMSV